MIFQSINNLKKYFIRQFRNPLVSKKGQTAVILILMIAIALVIYSASLNWGRIAQIKTLTTVAANSAASGMASMVASYGEQQLQTTLGGQVEICKRTSLIVTLVVLVVVVIVAIIAPYLAPAAAFLYVLVASVLAVAMATTAVVLEVAVIQPGLTRMWNKMQAHLPLEQQVIENAMQGALQSAVTDEVSIFDHFDMDLDGLWVNAADGGNIAARRDTVGRFSFYYTKRLMRAVPPNIIAIEEFSTALRELLYDNPYGKVGPPPAGCTPAELLAGSPRCLAPDNFGIYDPLCVAGSNLPIPYCDACCLPQFDTDGTTPLRPVTCTPADVALCTSGDYPITAYAFQYDPFRENFANAFFSFREQIGTDDENTSYNRNPVDPNSPPPQTLAAFPNDVFREQDTTGFYTAARQTSLGIVGGTADQRDGVFPFFWEMSRLLPVQSIILTPPPVLPVIPKADSVIMMTANPLTCTTLSCPNTFVAANNQCAAVVGYDAGTNRPRTDGFYWKPGSDQYCSSVFPYDDCITRVGNCANGAFTGGPPSCGCATSDDPTIWHDDYPDILVFQLKEFIIWAEEFLRTDLVALNVNFVTWWPGAAYWIAPQCTVAADCANPLSIDPSCRYCNLDENDGALIFWRDTLGAWVDLIDTWLYRTSFADDANYCLPTAVTAATALLPIERSAIPSLQALTPIPTDRNGINMPLIWGDLNDTVACLNFNTTNLAKLTSCQTQCIANPADYTGNANVCLNLPRSVINLRNSSAVGSENTAYAAAQRLQDCLSSTCQDSFGVTLPVCTGLPVAPPPNCTAWGAGNVFYDAVRLARDNQFNLSNYCEPSGGPTTGFQDNLVLAVSAAAAQDAVLIARSAELTSLRNEAVAARNTFLSGYTNLNTFLRPCAPGLQLGEGCGNCVAGGPVAQLICARLNYTPSSTGLGKFAIYGWQSRAISGRGPTGTDPDKGYWHLVRVEAFAPFHCFGRCGATRLPWVRTWTKGGFFNQKRCYGIDEATREGRTIARVTRYDEDRDSPGASLANGQLLWKFRFTNPGVSSTTVPGNVLSTDCRHPIAFDQGVSPATRIQLEGAFMINAIPSEDPTVSDQCWQTVNQLLDRGVISTSCSKYYFDTEINHFNLKFKDCNPAEVQYVTSCAIAPPGTCPEQ